jgi:peptidase E
VIWVDRGSLVNLLAVWRAHGLDSVLRERWQAGVVLGGESAGSPRSTDRYAAEK